MNDRSDATPPHGRARPARAPGPVRLKRAADLLGTRPIQLGNLAAWTASQSLPCAPEGAWGNGSRRWAWRDEAALWTWWAAVAEVPGIVLPTGSVGSDDPPGGGSVSFDEAAQRLGVDRSTLRAVHLRALDDGVPDGPVSTPWGLRWKDDATLRRWWIEVDPSVVPPTGVGLALAVRLLGVERGPLLAQVLATASLALPDAPELVTVTDAGHRRWRWADEDALRRWWAAVTGEVDVARAATLLGIPLARVRYIALQSARRGLPHAPSLRCGAWRWPDEATMRAWWTSLSGSEGAPVGTTEAAQRLGLEPATLYATIRRGLAEGAADSPTMTPWGYRWPDETALQRWWLAVQPRVEPEVGVGLTRAAKTFQVERVEILHRVRLTADLGLPDAPEEVEVGDAGHRRWRWTDVDALKRWWAAVSELDLPGDGAWDVGVKQGARLLGLARARLASIAAWSADQRHPLAPRDLSPSDFAPRWRWRDVPTLRAWWAAVQPDVPGPTPFTWSHKRSDGALGTTDALRRIDVSPSTLQYLVQRSVAEDVADAPTKTPWGWRWPDEAALRRWWMDVDPDVDVTDGVDLARAADLLVVARAKLFPEIRRTVELGLPDAPTFRVVSPQGHRRWWWPDEAALRRWWAPKRRIERTARAWAVGVSRAAVVLRVDAKQLRTLAAWSAGQGHALAPRDVAGGGADPRWRWRDEDALRAWWATLPASASRPVHDRAEQAPTAGVGVTEATHLLGTSARMLTYHARRGVTDGVADSPTRTGSGWRWPDEAALRRWWSEVRADDAPDEGVGLARARALLRVRRHLVLDAVRRTAALGLPDAPALVAVAGPDLRRWRWTDDEAVRRWWVAVGKARSDA